MSNPRKRRNSSHRRRRHNPHVRRRRNAHPAVAFGRHFFNPRRRRRNPSIGGMDMTSVLKVGAGAAIGGVGARSLTSLVLQSSNVGAVGYAGNFAASLALGWLVGKFAGKDVGLGTMAGGIAATIQRIWAENVSSTTAAMSGLGDPDFPFGMGAYVDAPFFMPSVSANQGNYLVTQQPPALPSGIAARSSGGVQPVMPPSVPIARFQASRLGL